MKPTPLRALALGLLLLAVPAHAADVLKVIKSPTCHCCTRWVEHMQENGFAVEAQNMGNEQIMQEKLKLGLTPKLASCHTGQIAGYVIEGHVPAREVKRLLAERPDAHRAQRAGYAGRLARHGDRRPLGPVRRAAGEARRLDGGVRELQGRRAIVRQTRNSSGERAATDKKGSHASVAPKSTGRELRCSRSRLLPQDIAGRHRVLTDIAARPQHRWRVGIDLRVVAGDG